MFIALDSPAADCIHSWIIYRSFYCRISSAKRAGSYSHFQRIFFYHNFLKTVLSLCTSHYFLQAFVPSIFITNFIPRCSFRSYMAFWQWYQWASVWSAMNIFIHRFCYPTCISVNCQYFLEATFATRFRRINHYYRFLHPLHPPQI